MITMTEKETDNAVPVLFSVWPLISLCIKLVAGMTCTYLLETFGAPPNKQGLRQSKYKNTWSNQGSWVGVNRRFEIIVNFVRPGEGFYLVLASKYKRNMFWKEKDQ